VPVIILDRWTSFGAPDSVVATKGVQMFAHSDVRFENSNNKVTFRIPVAHGAVFTHLHCVAVELPAQQKPSTLKELTRLDSTEAVILLTLDKQGRVVKAVNDPAC
jgi:hypothetical protein